MTLDQFFEKFELFADAPDAVAKMREFIRASAVEGKLVGRVFEEGTASEILRSAGVTEEASNGFPDIPNHWTWVRLGGVSTRMDSGWSPACQAGAAESGSWGVLKTTAVQRLKYQEEQNKALPRSLAPRPEHEVMSGDILFTRAGPMNRVGIVCVARPTRPLLMISDKIIRIHLVDAIDPEFASLAMNSGYSSIVVEGLKSGMAASQVNISQPKLKSVPIPLPPFAEQKRIVAKVDELMALCDRLEAQQQEREAKHAALARASLTRFADAPTPANLQFLFHPSYTISPADLRKSILTLAVQGKLVPQDPNDEPVEDLLSRNDDHRRETAQDDRRADNENLEMLSAEDCWDISETWSWRGMADLVLFVDYRGKTPTKISSGIRLLTAKNVRKGHIDLSPAEFLAKTEYKSWMTRGFPKVGDVLFTTEAPMGNAAVVELTEQFALAQRVICFQSYGALDPAFLSMQILSEQFQSILDKNGTGVTAKGIKASKLKRLPIAVPPIAEQRRIVAKVDELMAWVDALESELAIARTSATNLLAAAVAELTSN